MFRKERKLAVERFVPLSTNCSHLHQNRLWLVVQYLTPVNDRAETDWHRKESWPVRKRQTTWRGRTVAALLAGLASAGCRTTRENPAQIEKGAHMSQTVTATPRVLHVAAYGAVGDGTTDDGPAFGKAMAALVEMQDPAVLKLAAGKTYRIATLPGPPGENQSASRRGFVFPFVGMTDKALAGNGSHLVLRFPLRLLNISNSERITVRGFSFSYDPLPFTQGYIQAVDPDARTLDVKVEPGFPLPTFDAPDVQDHSRAWHFCWTFQPSCHVWTKTIKAIEDDLKGQDASVTLNSFIVSNTPLAEISWWDGGMTKAQFEERNVLFQHDDKDTYITKLLNKALEK